MPRIDQRSFVAITLFFIGLLMLLYANLKFQDVHVPTWSSAIETLMGEDNKRLILLWFCTLIGASLQGGSSILMVKLTWNSIKYPYEYNIWIHILLTICIVTLSLICVFYASKAVLGVIIIIGFIFLALYANDSKS